MTLTGSDGMAQMKIILNTTDGNAVSVDVRPDETYRMLKERLNVESGIELEISQIFYDGKQVSEDQNVYDSFLGANPVSKAQENNYRVCVVEGCSNSKQTEPRKEIFRFPLEPNRYSNWLLACNRHDLLGRIPISLNLECGVCSDHFPDSCFIGGNMRRRLRKNAVPVLDEPQSKLPLLAQEMNAPRVKISDEENSAENGTVTYVIQGTDNNLPMLSNILDQDEEHIMRKAEVASESTSNHDEVDEEDLQDDELDELEEDDEEEDVEEVEEEGFVIDSHQNHPGLICRLCANEVDTAHFIFAEQGRAEKLLDKISTSLPIAVHCNDLLPKQVCSQCLSTLNICYEFAMACIKAEETLQKMVSRFRCQTVTSTAEQPVKSDDFDESDTPTSVKENSPNEAQCYDCPLCCKGEMKSQYSIDIDEIEGKNSKEEGDVVQDFLADSVLWEEGEDFLDNYQSNLDYDEEVTENADECYACMVCGANFIALNHLFQHSEDHFGNDYFPCGRCGIVFNSKETHSIHLDLHINAISEEQYRCGECGKLFGSEARAEFHHEITHGIDGFSSLTCSECGQVFRQEINLWDHMQIVHRGEKPFSCPKCDKTFEIRSQLRTHISVHESKGPFVCDVCSETLPDKASLKSHEASHTDIKVFQCDQCGCCFTRKYLFTAHVRSHVEKKPRVYTCRVCGEDGFESLPKLLVHRRSVHQDVMLPLGSKKDKIHKCEQCNKAFTGRVALKHHAMSHAGDLPHVCEFCNKGFTQKRSLLLHRRIHTGEKPYECGDCGKRFVQSAHLYSHLRLHTGEKPYQCSECGATFRLKDVRDSHQRKHTGERPFKCKVCDKSFRTSHSYYQHTWIHTGRKPYPCTYCGKAFRRSNGLKVHIRIHTGEKPHECDVCGRGFAQKQDMKKHRNLHVLGRL